MLYACYTLISMRGAAGSETGVEASGDQLDAARELQFRACRASTSNAGKWARNCDACSTCSTANRRRPAPPASAIRRSTSSRPHGGVEVVMDLPGVRRDAVQIVFARGTRADRRHQARRRPAATADAAFHLAERTFGRFARACGSPARSTRARARATLDAGELRVVLPRIDERRGRADPHPDRDRLSAHPLHRRHLRQAGARDRAARHPRARRAATTSTSSSPTSRTPPPASASPATSPTRSSSYGVDVMTSGNHIWDKKEVLDYIPRQPKLLRPANFPAGVPGRGTLARPARAPASRSASST